MKDKPSITPQRFVELYTDLKWFPWYQEIFDAVENPFVRLVLVNCIRQSGKSTLLFLIMLYYLFNQPRFQAAAVASSKDTVKSIFRQKVSDVVARSPKLRADAKILNESVSVPRLMTHAELYPSESVGGLIGRSLNMLLLDECCLIEDESIAAALPSVLAKKNSKVIAISSSWRPSGYFYEAIMSQEKDPKKDVFLFRSDSKELNPSASLDNLDFMSRTLMKINPAYEKRFLSTEFAEIGDEFIPRAVVDSAVDSSLMNKSGSKQPCYAFLDLSLKRDLTSRVVVEYSGEQYTAINVQVFEPSGFFNKRIDFNAVKEMIVNDFESYPDLTYLCDERAEAGELLNWAANRGYPIEPFNATVQSNMQIWGRLCELLNDNKLRIPANQRLLNELYNLRIEEFSFGRSFRVTDASRKWHRDLSCSLAGAVWKASESQGEGGAGIHLFDVSPPNPWLEIEIPYADSI